MKKEQALVFAVILFLFAYALDYFAGPVVIPLKNPLSLIAGNTVSKLPLTVVAVFARAIAITTSIVLILSFLEEKYIPKFITALFLGVLFELYAIQQIATGTRITSIQWTLSFAYAAPLLGLFALIYLFKGIFTGLHKTLATPEPASQNTEENILDKVSEQ